MKKSRLAAFTGAVLLLAGGLLAQDFGSAPSAITAGARAHVYSQGEKAGFILILVAVALLVTAWHMAGKEHHSRW